MTERGADLYLEDAAPVPIHQSDQATSPVVPALAPLGHDVDDPHERSREDPPRRCVIEQLRLQLVDRDDPEALAIRRWLAVRDRAIAKGDVEPHECIDAAAARGNSRPNPSTSTLPVTTAPTSSRSERPRAATVPM